MQLGGGVKRGLLRVEQTAFLDGKPFSDMSGTHWVDASGQVLRMSMDVVRRHGDLPDDAARPRSRTSPAANST